jgi:Family of unknown function (DUF6152)
MGAGMLSKQQAQNRSSEDLDMKFRTATGRPGKSLIAAALALVAMAASAHHSFAAFFDHEKSVSVQGKVTAFYFTNPHGLVALEVTKADGSKLTWKGETNSPSTMARRGWTKQSVKVGDTVTMEGWPARGGEPYLRIRELKGPDGKPIGTPSDVTSEQQQ